jgi:hypothetical protein
MIKWFVIPTLVSFVVLIYSPATAGTRHHVRNSMHRSTTFGDAWNFAAPTMPVHSSAADTYRYDEALSPPAGR